MATPSTPTPTEDGGNKEEHKEGAPAVEGGAHGPHGHKTSLDAGKPKKEEDDEDDDVYIPGQRDSKESVTDQLNAWHNFESQYSLAIEQSAIIERETWGSQAEFLMSCIASAVGLGNIWRFPFICGQNGGAAFLVPYIIVLMLIGRPMYMLELGLGQFASGGPVKIWEMAPGFRGVGYTATVASFFLGSFYCVIMGWSVLYMIYSCFPVLPWERNEFPTAEFGVVKVGKNPEAFFGLGHLGAPPKDDNATDFALGKGLDGPPVLAVAMGLLASWIIIWGSMFAGVSGGGKLAYFTALFPYVVLFILLIGGATLKGATRGLKFFYYPEFSKILDGKAWFQAVAQCFFSLGITFGGCVMFSSYNKFHHKLGRDIIIIGIVDTFTSLLAGTCMFMLLGYLDVENDELIKGVIKFNENRTNGTNATEVPGRKTVANFSEKAGAGMAFGVFPSVLHAFGKYPFPNIFSFLFFFMLVVLAVGSGSGIVGAVVTVICDAFPKWKRKIVLTGLCTVSFFLGLIYTCRTGANVIDIVDRYGTEQVIFMLGIFETFAISYVYGLKNLCNDFEFMLGYRLSWYWVVSWGLVPALLVAIFCAYIATWKRHPNHPNIAVGMGWLLTGCTWMILPITMIVVISTRKSRFLKKRVKASFMPTRKWGPKDPAVREAWRRWKKTKPTEFKFTTMILRILGCKKETLPPGTQPFMSQLPIDSNYQAPGSEVTSSAAIASPTSTTTDGGSTMSLTSPGNDKKLTSATSTAMN